jgi:hypothetical protein
MRIVFRHVLYGTDIATRGAHSNGNRGSARRASRIWRTTSCTISIATSVPYCWPRLLLHQQQSWRPPNLKTPTSRFESTIGTTVIITTGMTTKTALTGVTCKNSTGVIVNTKDSITGCRSTIGAGATVIRTATTTADRQQTVSGSPVCQRA